MTTLADELRAAAERLRDVSPRITGQLAGLADPVAEWLDYEADLMGPGSERRGRTHRALDVARAVNGKERP